MKIYKNGEYESQRGISILETNAITDDKLFYLGKAGDNANMHTGSMDNATVYDFVLERVLTPENILGSSTNVKNQWLFTATSRIRDHWGWFKSSHPGQYYWLS